jgi:hypothetical protein
MSSTKSKKHAGLQQNQKANASRCETVIEKESISKGKNTEDNYEIFKLSPTTFSGYFPHVVGFHTKIKSSN